MSLNSLRIASFVFLIGVFILFFFAQTSYCSDSGVYGIIVSVSYLDFELLHISGGEYTEWRTMGVNIGDTTQMAPSEVVRFVSRSNIEVDILSDIADYPDSTTLDTLWEIWTPSVVAGTNTFVFFWSGYSLPVPVPAITDGARIFSSPTLLFPGMPPDGERFFYAFFIAPTEGVYGERHRLVSKFTITPSFVPATR